MNLGTKILAILGVAGLVLIAILIALNSHQELEPSNPAQAPSQQIRSDIISLISQMKSSSERPLPSFSMRKRRDQIIINRCLPADRCQTDSFGLNEFMDYLRAAHYSPVVNTEKVKFWIKELNKRLPDDPTIIERTRRDLMDLLKVLKIKNGLDVELQTRKSAEELNQITDRIISIFQKSDLLSFDLKTPQEAPHLWTLLLALTGNQSLLADFALVRAGSFQMGSPADEAGRADDEVLHSATIEHDFELQTTPMTQGQFFLLMGYNPSSFSLPGDCSQSFIEVNGTGICPFHPVENVSWEDVQRLATWLGNKNKNYVYSLPNEAEWEYSARAGTRTPFWFGRGSDPNEVSKYAWWIGNSKLTSQEVGKKPPNPWGLFDISGNIWELVMDAYKPYTVKNTSAADPFLRVMRGGSWGSRYAFALRSARRYSVDQKYRGYQVGFRLKRVKRVH